MSIPLKKAEAGLKSLSLFGKIASLNGKDYFVAEGKGKAYYFDNKLVAETKFFYTQDCVKWLDLNTVDEETGSFDGSDTLSDALGYTLWVIVLCLCCAFCCCLWHP